MSVCTFHFNASAFVHPTQPTSPKSIPYENKAGRARNELSQSLKKDHGDDPRRQWIRMHLGRPNVPLDVLAITHPIVWKQNR
jgi:hypothetical protein